MTEAVSLSQSQEPHPWSSMSSAEVLATVLYDLYGPVSALGAQVDSLASGSFEDDELLTLIDHIRESTNQLGRLVVTLKRYTTEHAGSE